MGIFGSTRRRASVIALSDVAVKWFDLTRTSRGEVSDVSWSKKTLLPGTVVGGIVRRPEAFVETLRIFRRHFHVSSAHLVLPPTLGMIVRVPHVNEADLGPRPERKVREFLEHAFKGTSSALDDCDILDLEVRYGVLYADLVPRSVMQQYENFFEQAGIRILSCEIERIDFLPGNKTIMALGIHDNATAATIAFGTLGMIRGGISFGGQDVVNEFSRVIGVSQSSAQDVVRQFGFLGKHHHPSVTRDLARVLDPLGQALGGVIKTWQAYPYRALHERGRIDSVFLYGDHAPVPGIADTVSALMELPVRTLSVDDMALGTPEALEAMSRSDFLAYAPLIGTAFREATS